MRRVLFCSAWSTCSLNLDFDASPCHFSLLQVQQDSSGLDPEIRHVNCLSCTLPRPLSLQSVGIFIHLILNCDAVKARLSVCLLETGARWLPWRQSRAGPTRSFMHVSDWSMCCSELCVHVLKEKSCLSL